MERNKLKSSALQPGQHLLLPAGTKLLLKTSQAPAKPAASETPAAAPVKEVAQAPATPVKTASIKPTTPTAAPAAATAAKPAATPSSTAKVDQKAAETIAVAREPAVEEPTGPVEAGSFRWPVRGRVISEYGSKSNGEKNEGINLAVPEGTSVKAADDGEVIYSGNELKGYGNLVLVRHKNGYVTAYAHASELLVNRGEKISRGQIIARAGATGSVSQPQLHFELRKGQKPIDPKPYLASN
jgi:murein DD-endopeptidase MepM/ murein hydrolase activator NlpD